MTFFVLKLDLSVVRGFELLKHEEFKFIRWLRWWIQ